MFLLGHHKGSVSEPKIWRKKFKIASYFYVTLIFARSWETTHRSLIISPKALLPFIAWLLSFVCTWGSLTTDPSEKKPNGETDIRRKTNLCGSTQELKKVKSALNFFFVFLPNLVTFPAVTKLRSVVPLTAGGLTSLLAEWDDRLGSATVTKTNKIQSGIIYTMANN